MYQEIQSEMIPLQVEPPRGLDLFDVLLIFARRKWVLVFFTLAGALGVLIWSLNQPKRFRANTVIMTPQDQQSSSSMLGQMSVLSYLSGMGAAKSPSDIYIGLLQSRTVSEKLARDFNLQKIYKVPKLNIAAAMLVRRTKISADKDGLITITVWDENAARAADLANSYSKALYGLNTTLAIGQASQRRLFFDRQLALEKDHLTDAEIALEQVEEKTGMINLNGQTSITISRVAQLQADITGIEIQLSSLRASATEENPEVVRLQSQLTGLRQQLSAMLGKPGSPLPDNLGIPSSRVPGLSLEYIRKERDVQYHQTLYDVLARQLEAARIDEAKAAPIVQVLDPAEVPDTSYFPKTLLFTILGAIGGLVLGFIRCFMLFIYDYIDEEPRLHMKAWAIKSALVGRIP